MAHVKTDFSNYYEHIYDDFDEDDIQLDFLDEDTKELCPKCGSSDIQYINLANKCNDCWYTW